MLERTIWNSLDKLPGPDGYWGPITASIDWCERNYQHSYYIAEFWNSLSNSGFLALAILGMYSVKSQSLPNRFALAYFGMFVVGVGSTLFHASLLFSWQLCDELPMVLTASFVAFIVFDTSAAGEQSKLYSRSLAIGIILFDIIFTIAYITFPNPVFHQASFLALQLISTGRGVYLLYFCNSRLDTPARIAQNRHSRKIQNFGTCCFLFAFFVWNLDNLLCDQLQPAKDFLGYPLAYLLNGHSWWHAISGIGVYNILTGVEYLVLCLRNTPENYEIGYVFFGLIPFVRRSELGKEALKIMKRA